MRKIRGNVMLHCIAPTNSQIKMASQLITLATVALLLLQAPIAEAVDCFENKATLRDAALRYGDGSPEAVADTEKYDAVIGDWCFNEALTDLSELFLDAKSFDADISGWNVSSVTNMMRMFSHAASFNVGLSGWDVSRVTNMANMFHEAIAFNADISGWDVSSVKDMGEMFSSAIRFNTNISGWDVSSVTVMSSMFSNATSFNGDLSRWDVSSVEYGGQMFALSSSFNSDLSEWDVSSLKVAAFMFDSASSFNQNLCAWRSSLQETITFDMFKRTACPFPQDPTGRNSPTCCQACPSEFPSASPTVSMQPSSSPLPSFAPTISLAPSPLPTEVLATSCTGKRESCTSSDECCRNRICYSVKMRCQVCRRSGLKCGKNSDCCGEIKCKRGECKN